MKLILSNLYSFKVFKNFFCLSRLEWKKQKFISLKILRKIEYLLDTYKEDRNWDVVFKELRMVNFNDPRQLRTRIQTATRNFNRRLSIVAEKVGIEKKLSMHIARHSFGNISGSKIPIQMLQKLCRYTSVTTTIILQSNFLQDDVENALDSVLIFWFFKDNLS